ncbi:MAG: hypothetical protein ABSC94_16655 [Polyangiaceae bacterium]|jgi:hypothetical protein
MNHRRLLRRSVAPITVWAAFVALTPSPAQAQMRGGRGQRQAPPPSDEPKSAPSDDDAEDRAASAPRTEPEMAPPADPLSLSPEVRARIGTDWDRGPPAPEGSLSHTRWFPYYEERQGDYRLRLLPPLFVEQTRGLRDRTQGLYGVPKTEDTEGLYGLFYYRRRSAAVDWDVFFPAFWRARLGESQTLVLGPWVHREAPGEHDNWLAPLYFEGKRPHGGYFHSPLLLTTSHWAPDGAFTLVGPYFRSRTERSFDLGIAPVYFHGDNGNIEGARVSYTLVPPLLYYHSTHELDDASVTVAGPVIQQSDARREVLDVLPLYFHIRGRPEDAGIAEEHTTLFPFFHYGHDSDRSLFILPGYYRQVTRTSDTLLSLFYNHIESRNGATSLTALGPIVPLWWHYRDRDLGVRTTALAPFFYTSESPAERDWLTPVIGRFETYGESKTWWVFPSFTFSTSTHGWENDLHPIFYVGRNDDASHTVVAPVFWDFANTKGRTTIGFPLYWRFADSQTNAVTQVAANTLYVQKKVMGGADWEFHFLPFFSYGENPSGYFWNVLFGLAGYSQYAHGAQVRAFWIPFGDAAPAAQAAASR